MAKVWCPFNMLVAIPGCFKRHRSSGAHAKILSSEAPRRTQIGTETPPLAVNARDFSSIPSLISQWDGKGELQQLSVVYASSNTILYVLCLGENCFLFPQETQYHILRPIYRTNCRWNVLNIHSRCIVLVWNTRHHLIGVTWRPWDEINTGGEMARRIHRPWFYMSMCRMAMVCRNRKCQSSSSHFWIYICAEFHVLHHPPVAHNDLLYPFYICSACPSTR